jgi:branched-chain amino acid aminotransferase
MTSPLHIPVQHNTNSFLHKVDFANLEFGKYMADHMMVSKYADQTWHPAAIVPYGPITMMPTALALHYGQSVFEGMKAFRMSDGNISIFRIQKHYDRLARTLTRMCMPVMPYELFEEGLKQLVTVDQAWVPSTEGSSLYIRSAVLSETSACKN